MDRESLVACAQTLAAIAAEVLLEDSSESSSENSTSSTSSSDSEMGMDDELYLEPERRERRLLPKSRQYFGLIDDMDNEEFQSHFRLDRGRSKNCKCLLVFNIEFHG